jgi:hypothetical protein
MFALLGLAAVSVGSSRLSALAASDVSLTAAKVAIAVAPRSEQPPAAASDLSLSAAKVAIAAARAAAADYSLDTTCTDSRIYFDCIHMASRKASGGDAFKGTPLGRLVFRLSGAQLLPKHTSNIRMLCMGERTGCAYSYSWCELEPGPPKLKAHLLVLRGRGRNAYGRSDELIVDEAALRECAHNLEAGGVYHGVEVLPGDWGTDTVLATPVREAGKGTSRLTILTGLASASPSLRRSLLIDQAVIGVLESPPAAKASAQGGGGVLRRDALSAVVDAVAGRKHPVKVSSCGEVFRGGQTSAVSCRFVPSPGVG